MNKTIIFPAATIVALALLLTIGLQHGIDRPVPENLNETDQPGQTRISKMESGSPRSTVGAARGQVRLNSGYTSASAVNRLTSATASSAQKTSVPLERDAYMEALLAQMEADGRDNAMVHYAFAMELAPAPPTERQSELISMVLKDGWDDRADELLPYLLQWHHAISQIHQGASLDYAKGIGFDKGIDTPVPDFLKVQLAAKMMAAYSRYLESKGMKYEARRQIQSLMKMGGDFNGSDNVTISHLIGTAVETVALNQLSALSAAGVYTGYEREAIKYLAALDLGERQVMVSAGAEWKMFENFAAAVSTPEKYRDYLSRLDPNQRTAIPSYEKMQKYLSDAMGTYESQAHYFSKPYFERELGNYQQTDYVPDLLTADIRYLAETSRLRQTVIDLAVQAFRNDYSRLPASLAELTSNGYLVKEPVDPFSGKGFTYQPNSDDYELYGSGPDLNSSADSGVEYSPVNGSVSPGVIRLR